MLNLHKCSQSPMLYISSELVTDQNIKPVHPGHSLDIKSEYTKVPGCWKLWKPNIQSQWTAKGVALPSASKGVPLNSWTVSIRAANRRVTLPCLAQGHSYQSLTLTTFTASKIHCTESLLWLPKQYDTTESCKLVTCFLWSFKPQL